MRWLGSSWKLALVCLAAACGGGDGDNPAGPGGGGGGGGGGGVAGTYQLVGADGAALPALVQSEACGPSQMVHGNLRLGAEGGFEMRFDRMEQNGQPDWTGDHGTWQQAGDELRFFSEAWGDQFEGEFWDGVLYLYYDLCSDGLGGELELAFAQGDKVVNPTSPTGRPPDPPAPPGAPGLSSRESDERARRAG